MMPGPHVHARISHLPSLQQNVSTDTEAVQKLGGRNCGGAAA